MQLSLDINRFSHDIQSIVQRLVLIWNLLLCLHWLHSATWELAGLTANVGPSHLWRDNSGVIDVPMSNFTCVDLRTCTSCPLRRNLHLLLQLNIRVLGCVDGVLAQVLDGNRECWFLFRVRVAHASV